MSEHDKPEQMPEESGGGGPGGCLKVVGYLILIGIVLVVVVFGLCFVSMRH